ncbi:hypothetical protein HMPREF7215_2529 [Pyramidobacter piscolens W5455]|uniref:Uncharacterized protein n=1 Tax=Pyramidobacter piscolens W5455 TaxID=352165 RepID=A0ABM9ZWV4_9BACT|nr:hypothetical protein HMPREF7215_2529 [Pyramidobacter piscolens W5455]
MRISPQKFAAKERLRKIAFRRGNFFALSIPVELLYNKP